MTDSGSLRLNGGDLIVDGGRVPHASAAGIFYSDVIADGTGFGNSEPLVRAINTLMTQGSWETLGPFGNRSPAIVVEIEGTNADALNAGEVWLSSLMNPGALEWLPPGQTVWTVFDAVWCYISRSEDERWDIDENAWTRRYLIPIKSLPHARSPELTVTPAVDDTVDIQITDGSSTTNWAGRVYPAAAGSAGTAITPAVVSGALRVTSSGSTSAGYLAADYTFTGAIPTTTPYLRVDARAYLSQLAAAQTYFLVSGTWVSVSPTQRTTTPPDLGNIVASTSYYKVPAGATALRVTSQITGLRTSPYLEVDQIRRVSRVPASTTNRQKVGAIYPGGSAPADGSLHVSHPVSSLGKTIVHTYPLGRSSPALMQYRTSVQTPTADTSAINGQRINFSTAVLDLSVQANQVPDCQVALWGKFQVDTAPVTFTWNVIPSMGGQVIGPLQTGVITLPVGTNQLVGIGLVSLPGVKTGSAGSALVRFTKTGGTGSISADEVWAFGTDEFSALTIVDAASGTPASGGPSTNLWINAPTVDAPAGQVLIGTTVEDARWPASVPSMQIHRFPREGVSYFVATFDAADASTDFTHYKRWTHHAAETS